VGGGGVTAAAAAASSEAHARDKHNDVEVPRMYVLLAGSMHFLLETSMAVVDFLVPAIWVVGEGLGE